MIRLGLEYKITFGNVWWSSKCDLWPTTSKFSTLCSCNIICENFSLITFLNCSGLYFVHLIFFSFLSSTSFCGLKWKWLLAWNLKLFSLFWNFFLLFFSLPLLSALQWSVIAFSNIIQFSIFYIGILSSEENAKFFC